MLEISIKGHFVQGQVYGEFESITKFKGQTVRQLLHSYIIVYFFIYIPHSIMHCKLPLYHNIIEMHILSIYSIYHTVNITYFI
jgi:hypothetical protein